MKRISVVIVLLMVTLEAWTQLAKPLQFKGQVHDFGNVVEEEGPVTHEFEFTNAGTKPLQILAVQPSCGCTTPGWSKEPIMPGKTGTIKAQYDPKGRPGYFNKSLTVTTDADAQPVILQIKGTVTSKNGYSAVEFQAKNGNLRLRSLSFNLGKIYLNDEFVVRDYEFYNAGVKPVSYAGKSDGPAHIRVTTEPQVVEPGKKGVIRLSYNGKLKGQYGFQSDHVTLHTDDELQPVKGFAVYATLEDYFPELTPEDLTKAPQLQIAAQAVEYGSMKQNQSVTKEIQVTNTGKSVLEIRSIQGNCSCIQSVADKTKLKSGESAVIKISFNPQDRKGTQTKSVTVYSNDPQNPVQRITLTGVVN